MKRTVRWTLGSIASAVVLCLALVGCEVGSALALASWAPPPRLEALERAPDVAPKLVVLGDSLAYGYRASPGRGWVAEFERRLTARYPNASVTNLSWCGAFVGDLRKQLRRAPKHADAVLIVAGGNDVMSFTQPYDFARNERSILGSVRAAYPSAQILVANVPDLSWHSFPVAPGVRRPLPAPIRALFSSLTNLDNAILEKTAMRAGATILDLHALTLRGTAGHPGIDTLTLDEFTARYVSDDGLHPNDAGYAMLADFAWPQVARALRIDPGPT